MIALLALLGALSLPGVVRAQTIVSLTFDDGIATQMQTRSLLASHGMRGTFHINSGNVGANSYYMTWADVAALNADGNEIAGHTVDHKRLTDLTDAQQRSEICDDAANLRARGYTVNTFAYPYGAGSGDTSVRQALVDCGYLSARKFGDLYSEGCTDSSCPFSEPIPPKDYYGVRTPEWQPDEYTLTDLQSWVTQTEVHGGGWMPIVFHDICNQCADSSVSLATFSAFLDWLQPRAANGTIVKRVREVVSPAAPSADVGVSMSDAPDPVSAGANVTYTLTVHNQGPDPAAAVTLSDPLPAGLTLVSASSTRGTCSGTTTVSCSIGTLNAGAANDATVTIVATAGPSAVPSVTNSASVTTSTPDPVAANDQASTSTTVDPVADLGVSMTDAPDPVDVDHEVTYAVTVHNGGPSDAESVSVTDPLPNGLTLVSATPSQGTCAGTDTVACDLGTLTASGGDGTITIVAKAGLDAVPAVSNTVSVAEATADPDGSNDQATTQTAVNAPPPSGYVRPRGASPMRVSLVPAFEACADANSTHGAPLAYGSCVPPREVSSQLTIGSPDANGAFAASTGSVAMKVVPGDSRTPADEADVLLDVSITDVRKAADLTDYAGQLNARTTLRLTDRLNGPAADEPATVEDVPFELPVTCAPTSAENAGAACAAHTSADAITPGIVTEGARSIWALGQVVIDDGGADGLAATPDNRPFAVQGLFVP